MTTLEQRVICQDWLESERGWGTRPDGCSLHLTEEDRQQYIQNNWDGMPDEVPNEYSRACGRPYPVQVSPELYARVQQSDRHGVRIWRPGAEEIVPVPVRTDAIGRIY